MSPTTGVNQETPPTLLLEGRRFRETSLAQDRQQMKHRSLISIIGRRQTDNVVVLKGHRPID